MIKKYPGATALGGIDLTIKRGVILGVLGANGSGKSSLLKILAGLARPTSGDARVFGEKPSVKTKSRVAYMPEIDHLTCG